MEKILNELTQVQKAWLSEIIITIVLADKVVKKEEISFVGEIINHLEIEEEKVRLLTLLRSGTQPELKQPINIPKETLASIYCKLIEICIADLELHDTEIQILKKISRIFQFSDSYTLKWMNWAKDGLVWHENLVELAGKKLNINNLLVPVKKLNIAQKKWYIDVVVAALMVTGLQAKREINFLKMMINSTDDPEEKRVLKLHVLLKHRPPIKKAPSLPVEVQVQVLQELVLILSANGDMTFKGQQLFKLMLELANLPIIIYQKLIEWCNYGIAWKKEGQALIRGVKRKISAEDEEALMRGILISHPNNNSIQSRELSCFMCEGDLKAIRFQVKPGSQKIRNNIFGIPVYLGSYEAFDPVDYNRSRVIVCPNCYYTSINKEMFRRNEKEKPPEEFVVPEFRKVWMDQLDSRRLMFENPDEIGILNCSRGTVFTSYRLAISAADMMAEYFDDEKYLSHSIYLKLTLAQVVMGYKEIQQAFELIREVYEDTNRLYINTQDNHTAHRCARIMMLIALFLEDEPKAVEHFDYLSTYAKDKADLLPYRERLEFNRVYTECQQIYDYREQYKKSSLNGFLIPAKTKANKPKKK